MIVPIDVLKLQVDTGDMTDVAIGMQLSSIEQVIRAYTNNNFQNRNVRFIARSESEENRLDGTSPYLRIGDTVQITMSKVNNGLYVVLDQKDGYTYLDRQLFDAPVNKITKIEYPLDVVQCAVELFRWKTNFGLKIGIKSESETLSRHSQSVTYEDSASLFMGYPVGILSGLSLHRKARC